MKKTQDKTNSRLAATLSLAVVLTASFARAQSLPTDPWAAAQEQQQQVQQQPQYQQSYYGNVQTGAANTGVVHVQQVGPVVYGSQPYQPTYAGGSNNIWNTKMPEFTGELTTWSTDYGQRATAPEVNMHNMLSITQHLRNMGYKIPTSFESKVKNAPAAVRNRIFKAMNELKKQNDPFSNGAKIALKQFEKETGLDYENLVGNSLNLISAK